MHSGLLGVKSGTADVEPDLAEKYEPSADGLAARQAAVQRLGQGLAPLAAVADAARLQQALAVLRDLRQWLDQNR